MIRMITFAVAMLLAGIAIVANAQEVKTRPSISEPQVRAPAVPSAYLQLLDGYTGWTPETEKEPLANSVYNWTLRASDITKDDTTVQGAVAWLFSLSEPRFTSLVATHAATLRTVFGGIYERRDVKLALAKAYTADTDKAYSAWYACVGSIKGYADQPIGDYVLSHINWNSNNVAGPKNECQDEFVSLSKLYDVSELRVDELMLVGFFHRRFAANQTNPKLLPAETIRKAMHEVFDNKTN